MTTRMGERAASPLGFAGYRWALIADQRELALRIFTAQDAPWWSASAMKGAWTESVGEHLLSLLVGVQGGRGEWVSLTPYRSGAGSQGIDSLFVRQQGDGSFTLLLVGESKFGSSKLGLTRTGQQLSESWTRPRLMQTGGMYGAAARGLEASDVAVAGRPNAADAMRVPLRGGTSAEVWHDGESWRFWSSDPRVRADEVAARAREIELSIDDAVAGVRPWRARLFRFSVDGREFKVSIDAVSDAGEPIRRTANIRSTFEKLPRRLQTALRGKIRDELLRANYPIDDVDHLADQFCREPEQLSRLLRRGRGDWRTGMDLSLVRASVMATALAALAEVVQAKWSGGVVEWDRVAWSGVLAGGAAGLGYYVSMQVTSRLVTTRVGQAVGETLPARAIGARSLAGGLAGGVVVGVVIAYGRYLLGWDDLRVAHRTAFQAGVGAASAAAFSAGAMGVAVGVGTAGTGAAISGLSGAAMTNAALAWLGGGSIAAGGGGMALGATILSGGAAIVGVIGAATVATVTGWLDARERCELLRSRLQLTRGVLRLIPEGA